ncbi:MAG TPA: UDP-N-acetylmuramate dehydrogenase, partial [Acidimicrobiia bacterium]|nr:UDP-N-acetylmuramate dehydrogenase [Acidimicrobiia bacterium]
RVAGNAVIDRAALDDLAVRLAAALPGSVRRDAPSAALTTYRCGGPLAVLVRVDHERDLVTIAEALAAFTAAPVLVIGRGSNLLIADSGFAGLAIVLGGELDTLAVDTAGATVEAGGAVALPVLARRAAAAGIGGLEFYVGIPGSVGGAVRMNAGGHGAQTGDVLVRVRVVDLAGARAVAVRAVPAAALRLGYRSSVLGAREVVTAATFRGRSDDPDACGARIDEIVRWRREHQPGGQNAGSVFTNPPGDAAGRLIEACGLKGRRVGGVVVSEKHANFFVAEPGARAADVVDLMREVRESVEAATGVRLEPELQLVGFETTVEERRR